MVRWGGANEKEKCVVGEGDRKLRAGFITPRVVHGPSVFVHDEPRLVQIDASPLDPR